MTRLSGIAAWAPARVAPSTLWHVGVMGALAALTALVVLPAIGLPPLPQPYNHDNIWALSLGADPLGSYFTDPPDGVNRYRPFTYVTLWAQYQIGGLDPSAYFAINIALWIACGCVVYALGYMLGRSWLAAGVAAFLLLVDDRGMAAIVWVPERATTIACLMGGIALLLAYRLPRGRTSRAAAVTSRKPRPSPGSRSKITRSGRSGRSTRTLHGCISSTPICTIAIKPPTSSM